MTIQDIESYEDRVQRGGAVALRRANEFFGLEDPVFKSFFAVTAKLNELGEPYVVGGQLAMTAYGCSGTTPEVQIFLTRPSQFPVKVFFSPPVFRDGVRPARVVRCKRV
jgi:hypothetical protein